MKFWLERSRAWRRGGLLLVVSGQAMEIRSTGPDQKLWTLDDLVTR